MYNAIKDKIAEDKEEISAFMEQQLLAYFEDDGSVNVDELSVSLEINSNSVVDNTQSDTTLIIIIIVIAVLIFIGISAAFFFYKKRSKAKSQDTMETINKQQIEMNGNAHVNSPNQGVAMERINSDEGMSMNSNGDNGVNGTMMMHHKLSVGTPGDDDIVVEAINMAVNQSQHDQDMDIVASINETAMRQPGSIGSENGVIGNDEEKEIDFIENEKDYDIINQVNKSTAGYEDQNTANEKVNKGDGDIVTAINETTMEQEQDSNTIEHHPPIIQVFNKTDGDEEVIGNDEMERRKTLGSGNKEKDESEKSDLFYDERWAVQKQTNFNGIDDGQNAVGTAGE